MLAVEDLLRHNVPQEDISVQLTDTATGREFFTEMATKAPEYGVVGAMLGGILGGVLAAMCALGYIDASMLGLTGLNVVLASLCGIGAGMLLGLIIGMIAGTAIPEYETNFYTVGGKHCGMLVGVYCDARREFEVKRLMEAAGGNAVRARNVKDEPLRVYGNREYVGAVPSDTDRPAT